MNSTLKEFTQICMSVDGSYIHFCLKLHPAQWTGMMTTHDVSLITIKNSLVPKWWSLRFKVQALVWDLLQNSNQTHSYSPQYSRNSDIRRALFLINPGTEIGELDNLLGHVETNYSKIDAYKNTPYTPFACLWTSFEHFSFFMASLWTFCVMDWQRETDIGSL